MSTDAVPRFSKKPLLPAEWLDEARRRFEAREANFNTLALECGRSQTYLRRIAKKEGWTKCSTEDAPPLASTGSEILTAMAALPQAPAPIDPKHIMQGLANTALRLMNALEQKLANEAASEPDTRMMGNLIKMLGDFRKSGIENGENDLSGALNGNAGAESADFAEDMARMRTQLAESLNDPSWRPEN
jgi:hypothetical protein